MPHWTLSCRTAFQVCGQFRRWQVQVGNPFVPGRCWSRKLRTPWTGASTMRPGVQAAIRARPTGPAANRGQLRHHGYTGPAGLIVNVLAVGCLAPQNPRPDAPWATRWKPKANSALAGRLRCKNCLELPARRLMRLGGASWTTRPPWAGWAVRGIAVIDIAGHHVKRGVFRRHRQPSANSWPPPAQSIEWSIIPSHLEFDVARTARDPRRLGGPRRCRQNRCEQPKA